LKNRYGDKKKKTVIDIDYNYMRLTQKEINDNANNEPIKPPITGTTIVDDASAMLIIKININKKEKQKKVIDFS
jgi:hypothetical protein